ncbi:hypothetical protein L9F63_003738, partial [Diploptera punctata]
CALSSSAFHSASRRVSDRNEDSFSCFESCKSVVTVQRAFRRQCKRVERQRVSEENVAAATFQAQSQRNQCALETVSIVNGFIS